MLDEHVVVVADRDACAIDTTTTTTTTTMMSATCQLGQQRLKCGEVFIWDCVGELFAVECLLCEERPLCTLAEFAEHMDIWHNDWTAEAHATTTSACFETLNNTECAELGECTAVRKDYSDNIELDHFELEAGGEWEMQEVPMVGDMAAEVEMEMIDFTQQNDAEQPIMVNAFDTNANTFVPFEDLLMDVQSAPFVLRTTEMESILCLEAAQGNATIAAKPQTHSAQANTISASVKKQVENPDDQRLKTEKLIAIYEKFPELWHGREVNVVTAEAQTEAYHQISRELKQHGINLKASGVQRRLGVLRKRYRLEKFAELKCTLEQRPHKSSFEFYAQLEFLKEHIEPQLCKVCNRICKNATKCCGSNEAIPTKEEECKQSSESEENEEEIGAKGERCMQSRESEENEETISAKEECKQSRESKENEEKIPAKEELKQSRESEDNKEENESKLAERMKEREDNVVVMKIDDEAPISQDANSALEMPEAAIEMDLNESTPKEPQRCGIQTEVETQIAADTFPALPTETLLEKEATKTRRRRKKSVSEPAAAKRILRKRNKIEILEVIELQPALHFKTQEPEVSTSTPEFSEVKIISEKLSTSVIDAAIMADEDVASIEYDSSNGDSGILRDYDEQNDDADGQNVVTNSEAESFARLTTEQVHKLIQLYEQQPILWDPEHANFSRRERRRKAWRQMTTQLNETFQMRYTWMTVHRKMHDYVKYYRREWQRIESEGGHTRWCFYDDFRFMSQVLAEQGTDASKQLLSKQQNQKIIEVYAEHPQLWNINHGQFKRRRLRQALFKSISDKLRETHNINITPHKLIQRIVEFRCTYRLEKERRFAHEAQGETYKPCYEYYNQLNFLDPHIAPFVCAKCGVQYKRHTEIERHMRREHNNKKKAKNVKPTIAAPHTEQEKKSASLANVCHICGISFTMERNLKCHLKRHTEQRTHACAACPKKFFDRATLRVHERSHTKQRPFICEQCGATYVSGSKLNQHIKRHSNKRDHPCKMCDKAFYTAFECDRHMRTHMNIREKVCTICGKDFSVGSSYYAHMLLHADEKRYTCKICDKQFAQFAGLYKHRRRHHPAEFARERAKKNGVLVEEENKKETALETQRMTI